MARRSRVTNLPPDDTLSINDAQSSIFEPVTFQEMGGTNALPSENADDTSTERDINDDMPDLLREMLLESANDEPSPDIVPREISSKTFLPPPRFYEEEPFQEDEEDKPLAQSVILRSLPSGINDPAKLAPEMRAALCDYSYWMGLVERLGYDHSIYQTVTAPSLDTLSRYFDSSERGLLRVFYLFDKDHDSILTFDEISRGLKQQGLYTKIDSPDANTACEDLCDLIASKGTRDVRPPEFLWALKNLRLAALMHNYAETPEEEKIDMHLHEYTPERLISRSPLDSPVYFLFQPGLGITEGMNVRWVHCHDASRKAVLGIAMKYGLDPRFVLDVFTLWREQAKLDSLTFASQPIPSPAGPINPQVFFLVVPVLRLTERSEQSLKEFRNWKAFNDKQSSLAKEASGLFKYKPIKKPTPCLIVEIEHCNLAMLVASQGSKGQIISFSSEWGTLSKIITDEEELEKAKEAKKRESIKAVKLGGLLEIPEDKEGFFPASISEATEEQKDDNDLAPFKKIIHMLKTSYSILRTGDSQTFLLKSLCAITEDYRSITEAYDAAIYVLQKRLEHKKDQTSHLDIKRMRKAVRQLSHLYRLVRPFADVAGVVSGMHKDDDSSIYVAELQQSVNAFLANATTARTNFRTMLDDYHRFSESRVTSVVFALTMVFTICAPGQFVGAIYGMNFRSTEPNIPELLWTYGYLFYWLVVISIVCLLLLYIYSKSKQGWIKS